MIKRITHLLRRIGDKVFPLPSADTLLGDYMVHARREAIKADAMAELHEAEAKRERITAEMLHKRADRLAAALNSNCAAGREVLRENLRQHGADFPDHHPI